MGTVQNGFDKLKLNYSYGGIDNNGNVQSQTITVPTAGANNGFSATQTYTYDSLNRLKSATENLTPTGGASVQSWKQTFLFDRYGNRNFDTTNNNTTTLGTCPTAQCNPSISATNNRFNSGQGYTYDSAGNVLTDPQGRTFTFDGENKQKEVKDVNNVVVGTYFYDGDGKRVKKVVGNEVTIFVYDAGGKLVAEYSNQTNANPQVSYLTSDNLGSPRITTDANGNVISRRDFHPFGEEVYTAQRTQGLGYAGDAVRQKFTAYERDNETDLDFAQARMYSNKLGRFTSVDPENYQAMSDISDPQSWNAYAYVNNNPLIRVDPTGKGFWTKLKNSILWGVWGEEEDVQKEEESRKNRLIETAADLGNADGSLIFQNFRGDWVRISPSEIRNLSRTQTWLLGSLIFGCEQSCRQTIPSDQMADVVDFAAGAIQPSSPSPQNPQSEYIDVTKKGSIHNRQTDVTKSDFINNLKKEGYSSSVSKDGKATILEKGNTRYTVRDNAKSTGGPTAEVFKNGQPVEKIRLKP